jgi:hypothetical protein
MPEHQGGTSRFVRGADYFSILKRGINGVYHHISHEHLPMYLAEFDFATMRVRDLASAIRNALANCSRVLSASD